VHNIRALLFLSFCHPWSVGPTVDQRAEPVPKIHSIGKHQGPFGGKEMSELQNKEQNKEKKQNFKQQWIAAQRIVTLTRE
jgi:hypothetical protein